MTDHSEIKQIKASTTVAGVSRIASATVVVPCAPVNIYLEKESLNFKY